MKTRTFAITFLFFWQYTYEITAADLEQGTYLILLQTETENLQKKVVLIK